MGPAGCNAHARNEPAPPGRWLVVLAAAAAALGLVAGHADGPPATDYARFYGRVLADNTDLQPQTQPVIALVRGAACGDGLTKAATEPPADAGKTVYTLQVLADGANAGQRPGCGREGDPVTFYLPAIGRIALERPPFRGNQAARADLTLTMRLPNRMTVPMAAGDGAP